MIVNWLSTIAYKCPVCGAIEFNYISIFDFSGKKEYTVGCSSCGEGFVKIITINNKKCVVSIPCIACDRIHRYTVNFKQLWTESILNFKCAETKIQLCFIGNDDRVRQSVDKYEMQMDSLMKDIGYEDDFTNSTVMLGTIDKIHDVAEKGNLFCVCGSDDIGLQMFRDKVALSCSRCHSYEIIEAATNHDLKKTLRRESIILSRQMGAATCGNHGKQYKSINANKRIDYNT